MFASAFILNSDTMIIGMGGFVGVDDVPTVQQAPAATSLLPASPLIDAFAHHLPDPATGRSPTDERLDRLTVREREVLAGVIRGRSNSEIAESLHVAEATVKTHVGRILSKLGLRDRVQVVVFAYEAGIIRPGTDPFPQ